jgi:hypothetical protein
MLVSTRLLGDSKHGQAERVQTFRGPACRTTFSARRDTPLSRLKTPSQQVAMVLAALAEGLDPSAAERIFGYRTDPLPLLVADIDFPDLGRAPEMQRDRRRGQQPFADGTEMVGIDFLPKGDHASRAVQKRAGGGSRLSECDAGPTMQVSLRLQMLGGHRHRHHDPFRGRFDDLHL